MVSTRKAPGGQGARTNNAATGSAQPPVPRNTQTTAAAPAITSVDRDAKTGNKNAKDQTSKKGKQKGKTKEKKNKKSKGKRRSFVDGLARLFLLWFTIYTLSVCPEDDHLKSPICRGLYHYRRLILEPYVFPYIETALKHPSIAPYYEIAKPHIQQAYEFTQPLLVKARTEFNTHVAPQWEQRVIPAWETIVLPQIQAHIIPQYNKHALPYIKNAEKHLGPYKAIVEKEYHTRLAQYNRQLAPHLHTAIVYAGQAERAARPYVILASKKAYEGYLKAKPYAVPAWEKFKEIFRQIVAFLAVQRREYVDPHVVKIWEKVKERSGIDPAVVVPRATTSISSIVKEAPKSASSFASKVSAAVSSHVSQASSSVSSISVNVASSTESAVGEASEVVSNVVSTTSSVVEQVSASVASAATGAMSRASSISQKIQDEAISIGFIPAGTPASSFLSAAPTVLSQAASSATAAAASVGDPELDDFFADIGMSEDETPLESEAAEETATSPPEPTPETQEQKAARLAKIAEQRAEITKRHADWEDKLDAQIMEGEKKFRRELEQFRADKAKDLKSSADVRAEIDALVADAEKYLKGAEGYLQTLKKDQKTKQEKSALWDRVLEKIEDKFTKRLAGTESVVNNWYEAHTAQEVLKAQEIGAESRAIADAGQTDMGMDYAWLDDVTYLDWQRYHDLVGRSNNHTHDLLSIVDGSHTTPVVNPIMDVMNEIRAETEDIVIGFENSMRRLNRDSARSFDDEAPASAPSNEENPSEPEVSILPIPSDLPEPGVKGTPPVVIGRGAEEILEALGRVEAQEQTEALPPVKNDAQKEPGEIADEVAKEAEDELAQETPVVPPHVEL